MQRGLPERRKIKDVKKVIAVSSAKGGVGKSTIAGLNTDQNYQKLSKRKQSTSPWRLLDVDFEVAS
jgi:ATP-binding protein involved in chromosome partitioning